MAVTPTRRTGAKRSAATEAPLALIVRDFKHWLGVKDEAATLGERQTEMRDRLINSIKENGVEDDKGNLWLDLPEPVEFKDRKGKIFQYASLKRQRSMVPANPGPDPERTEVYLRKRGLWLKPEQEEMLDQIQIQCPYVTITVTVDTDAVAGAYFKGVIPPKMFDKLLVEQREQFSFIPSESK
jgi:hypothetical protein